MKFLVSIFLSVSLFSFLNVNALEEDGVLVLKDSNFDVAIADYRYLLVEFCKLFLILFRQLFLLKLLF